MPSPVFTPSVNTPSTVSSAPLRPALSRIDAFPRRLEADFDIALPKISIESLCDALDQLKMRFEEERARELAASDEAADAEVERLLAGANEMSLCAEEDVDPF